MEDTNFEQALKQLEDVVRKLENGDVTLEESMKLFEKGVALSRICGKQLDNAEAKIEVLLEKNGKLTKKPFNPQAQEE